MRMSEETSSRGTNWSSIYSFFKLFTWKWSQTYRCKNKNSTQKTRITFSQIRLLLNICPTRFIICFLSRVLFLTYIPTLLHSHLTQTHLHPIDTHSDKHMPSFVGPLCDVLFENNKEVSEGRRFKMKRKQKGLAYLMLPQLCSFSLPPMQAASSQVFWFRDELLSGLRPEEGLVTEDSWLVLSFSLNNKNHKKQPQSIYINHGNSFIIQNNIYNICLQWDFVL